MLFPTGPKSAVSLVSSALLATLTLCGPAQAKSHSDKVSDPVSSGRFEMLREPSGVIALDLDTLLAVEDESSNAVRRLSLIGDDPSSMKFKESELPAGNGFIQRYQLAPLDDLEGIARVSSTQAIVAGSHENASKNKKPERERILLLTFDGNDVSDVNQRRDLFDQIAIHYPDLAEIMTRKGKGKPKRQPLNIEAIAFDRQRMHLHIGLRAPLVNGDAIVIRLDNALDYLAGKAPVFAGEPRLLDLDEGGIRGMAYDDGSDQLLIISKRESGGKKRSRLWSLSLANVSKPIKYKSDDKDMFENVEGLTPFAGGVLFVRDQGEDRIKEDWFVLERSQLGL